MLMAGRHFPAPGHRHTRPRREPGPNKSFEGRFQSRWDSFTAINGCKDTSFTEVISYDTQQPFNYILHRKNI